MSKASIEHVATFVASPRAAHLSEAVLADALRRCGHPLVGHADWLDPGAAADIRLALSPAAANDLRDALPEALAPLGVDAIVQPAAQRRKKLLVADMDSTVIEQECIDELAEFAGLREHVAKITARAMQGEIAFEPALLERVALLAGLRAEVIGEILETRITLTSGARTLVATMRAHGAYTALVSGGFTLFADPVAARAGFHEARANRLVVENGVITGAIAPPILGVKAKLHTLEELRARLALEREATLATGDGANDLEMLQAAGLGVAFHAKPKVAEAAAARIDCADLTALLFAQGYRRAEFVS